MSRTVIVDIQGFKFGRDSFVFKEVTVLDCTTFTSPNVVGFVFDPPFPYHMLSDEDQRQTCWLRHNLGLHWDERGIPYHLLPAILKTHLSGAELVFVKGCDKKVWLWQYLPPDCQLVDLHDWNCPSLQTLLETRSDCGETMKKSLLHVSLLFEWLCDKACRELGKTQCINRGDGSETDQPVQ